jgi:hypothetical protein
MKFLVALCTGGLMESPELEYSKFEVIEAQTLDEASKIYNDKNKCFYFYGSVMAYKGENSEIKIVNDDDVTLRQLKMLD